MQKPYFLDPKMPFYVRKYMDEHQYVDVDVMTRYIKETYKPKAKEKSLRLTVRAAHAWNVYLIEQENLKKSQSKETSNSTKDSSPQKAITNGKEEVVSLDTEIEQSIIEHQKERKKYVFSYQSVLDTVSPQDWIGDESVKESVNFIMSCVLSKTEPSVNVLLSGPERCGKTTLATVIKQELDVDMFEIDIEEMFRGGPFRSPVKKLQEEITKLHSFAPGIILIHKLEMLYTKEPGSSRSTDQDSLNFCSVLQNYILQLSKSNEFSDGLLIIGETSKPEFLDWKLARCFMHRIRIPPPSVRERELLLKHFCKNHSLRESVDLQKVALKASGFVADDLKMLVTEASIAAKFRCFSSCELLSRPMGDSRSIRDKYLEHSNDIADIVIDVQDFAVALKKVTPSLKRAGFPSIPDTTWDNIGGLQEVKEKLREHIIKPIIQPQLHKMFGLEQKSGVLLWGPPGCGKTLLAKAVANEAGISLLIVNGPELLSMYQGESERAVREVFARAASVAPCVIFFDEFDSLCSQRSKTGYESGSKSTIVNMLLTEMDGFISRDGIYLMAATNLPAVIDPAALRPGRFDTKLYVDFPDASDRAQVLEAAAKNSSLVELAPCVNLKKLAAREELAYFTGADCHNLVKLAKTISLREYEQKMTVNDSLELTGGKRSRDDDAEAPSAKRIKGEGESFAVTSTNGALKGVLMARHFEEALKQIKPSVSEEQRKLYEEQKYIFEG